MAALEREGRRTAVVVALLVAIFLLTAFLALRGVAAARYHRTAAERVIRDYTRVALDELARRVEGQGNFYGAYLVLQEIARRAAPVGADELRAAATSEEARRNAALVKSSFRFDATSGLRVSAGTSSAVAGWLRGALPSLLATPPPQAQRRALHARLADGEHVFPWMLGERGEIDGFELDQAALAPFVELALRTGPLLPAALGDGRLTNDGIHLRLVLGDGGRLFETSPPPDEALAVRRTIADGLLRGATVDAALDRKLAPLAVFGGVPRPASAIYFVPLALAGLLLAVAIVQLRKELALARLREEFVASVSHELRTPLTQIRMFAETLLLDRVRSDAERRRSLEIVDQEARRLTQLVENILQFSRSERGGLRLSPRPVELDRLAAETIEAFAPLAGGRGVRFASALEPVTVSADEDAVRQVLLNLLDNAVKYGPKGQDLHVEVARRGAEALLAVEDRGLGVPKRERRRVFSRYHRLERDRGGAVAGAGIGLAVVAELVAAHGGRVWIEDREGGGARFVVALPMEPGP